MTQTYIAHVGSEKVLLRACTDLSHRQGYCQGGPLVSIGMIGVVPGVPLVAHPNVVSEASKYPDVHRPGGLREGASQCFH